MSGGIFELDEDRDKGGSARSSPSQSPRFSPRGSPCLPPAEDDATTAPIAQPSPVHPAQSKLLGGPTIPALQMPVAGSPNVFNVQPQAIGRKSGAPYAATPSFPSPLAQAITVPIASDTSSSESHSDDDPSEALLQVPASPTRSGNSTPRKGADQLQLRPRTSSPSTTSQSDSPASTQKSLSRPESPIRTGALTPSSLLQRPKRLSTGPLATDSPPGSGTVPPSRKISPIQQTAARRFSSVRSEAGPSSPTVSERRMSSGSSGSLQVPGSLGQSSPLAFGSPDMDVLDDSRIRRRSTLSSSDNEQGKDANLLGLGWNIGGWDGSSSSLPKDRGKMREMSSQPSSPKLASRDRERISHGFIR